MGQTQYTCMSYHSLMTLRISRSVLYRALFLLLFFSILWRGGKSLDATWILAMVTSIVALADGLFVLESEKTRAPIFPWILALLFLGWTILSFLNTTTANYGLDEVMQTASLFFVFQFALSVPERILHSLQSRFARILAATAVLACAIGIIVYILQPVSRFTGTFFDYRFHTDYWPNAWAEFLLLSWPLALWSAFGRKETVGNVFGKVSVVGLLLACLFLSYSRGSIIVFIIQLFLLAFLFVRRFSDHDFVKKLLFGSLATLSVSIALFFGVNHLRSSFHPIESVLEKATFTAAEGTSSVSERRQFWNQATAFALQKPMIGFGPYSFRFLQPHLQTEVLATSDHPHNVFLKLAMERGAAAALLFGMLVLWCSTTCLVAVRRKRKAGSDDVLSVLMIVSLAGVLLHNLIDYNLQFVGIALPFWFSLGLIVPRASGDKSGTFLRQNIVSLVVALALITITLVEGRFLVFSSLARRAEAAGDDATALLWYSKTDASLFPRDAWLSRARLHLRNDMPVDAQTAVDHALRENEHDYRAWKLQGEIDLTLGNRGGALFAFENAYKFGKYNDLGIARVLFELLLQESKPTVDARRHEFELLLNDFGLAILQNIHFIDFSDNVEELSKLAELFIRRYPADASLYRALEEKAKSHAELERSRLSARPRGLLW